MMNDMLPELDRRATQATLEGLFEKYRIYKTITFMDKETSVTASYTDRPHGPTNKTSDATASTAIHNVHAAAARAAYCNMIDTLVARLSDREQLLIQERYLKQDDVFDYKIYNHVFDPPVSKDTYSKIRTRAFYKLALALADRGMIRLEQLRKKTATKA